MSSHTLQARVREKAGKFSARRLLSQGHLPAVIYGDHQPVSLISVTLDDFIPLFETRVFFIRPLEIVLPTESIAVLPRDVQLNPLTNRPIHVDFLRVSEETFISVKVPCRFINHESCPGLKHGGLLNIIRPAISVRCRVLSIPEQIEVDLSGFQLHESIHISKVRLPENLELDIIDRDFTVATILSPNL